MESNKNPMLQHFSQYGDVNDSDIDLASSASRINQKQPNEREKKRLRQGSGKGNGVDDERSDEETDSTTVLAPKSGRPSQITLKNFMTIIEGLKTEIIALKEQVATLEQRVSAKDGDLVVIQEKMKVVEVQQQQPQPKLDFSKIVSEGKSQSLSDDQLAAIKVSTDEMYERKRREKCLLLSGCEELDSESEETEEDRQQHAKKLAEEVFRVIGVKLKYDVYRFRKTNNEYSSFIKVTLRDVSDRGEIFKNLHKLRKSSKFKHIYVNPDLTVLQRKVRKELLIARNKKNDELNAMHEDEQNKVWVIKGESLVLIDKKKKEGEA